MAYSKTLANTYASNRDKYRSSDTKVTPFLRKAGVKGKVILDFGCGDGPEAKRFISMGAKRVVGTDPSGEMIRLAKSRNISNTKFIKNDGKVLPLKAKQFDLAYARYVLHYIRDLDSQFSEIRRVLTPKGYFIALFQCLTDDPKLLNKKVPVNLGTGKDMTRIEILSKSADEIRQSLTEQGFKLLKLVEVKNTDSRIDPKFPDRKKFKNVTYVLFAQRI